MVEDNRGVGDVSGKLQQEMSQIKNENYLLKVTYKFLKL